MTNTFEATLANLISQKSNFESMDERAVEIGVVLPLLRQVGWNTDNVSEIYPQHGLSDGSKVDYDLQIDGESRVLIEVKRWGHVLNDEDEDQLTSYCRLAKPKLAVLTSGRSWRLYLPPSRSKSASLRRFLDFDITNEQPTQVKRNFNRFLARDKMSEIKSVKSTENAARRLFKDSQEYERFKKELTEAWDKLAKGENEDALAELVSRFAENVGIQTNPTNVTRFLGSLQGPLVNEVPVKVNSYRRPASFSIPGSPAGKTKRNRELKKRKGWNNFLLEICELMKKRHPESFRQNILSVPGWFSELEDSKFEYPIGETGIYARWGGSSGEVRDACYEIVTKFEYPRDSLAIRDSKGAIL